MFIPRNRGFKRRYVYGGAGILDSIASLLTSSTAKQIADVGTKAALDIGKNVALDVGKKITQKVLTPAARATKSLRPYEPRAPKVLKPTALRPKSQAELTKKSKTILSKYTTPTIPINTLIDGSGTQAIAIQDLVKKLNGSGLKMI